MGVRYACEIGELVRSCQWGGDFVIGMDELPECDINALGGMSSSIGILCRLEGYNNQCQCRL
jgi:hypothetical protein